MAIVWLETVIVMKHLHNQPASVENVWWAHLIQHWACVFFNFGKKKSLKKNKTNRGPNLPWRQRSYSNLHQQRGKSTSWELAYLRHLVSSPISSCDSGKTQVCFKTPAIAAKPVLTRGYHGGSKRAPDIMFTPAATCFPMVSLLSWSLAELENNVESCQGLPTSGWETECVCIHDIVQPLRETQRERKGKH